jgi:RNA-directed DNA polymerase
MKEGKSYEISKHQVFEAYKRVKANRGAPGVDGMDFTAFEKNLKNNLYKIWNRMSSGSYMPAAVKGVEIPKKNGKMRLLGVPTIMDRVAQMVVRLNFEPLVEPVFCEDSYGYRPSRSATDAIGVTRQRCWKMPWLIEFDIIGLFDNIDHELMMKAVRKHTENKWIILYIERFLCAPIVMPNGVVQERTSGTPQGGVISPVLANLYMHYAFDQWMERQKPRNPWARYADDGVIHCWKKAEAEQLLEELKSRMKTCKLEIHPDKTRIVYCRSDRYQGGHEYEDFTFLGYTFRKRYMRNKQEEFFNGFSPAASKSAGQVLRERIRNIRTCNKSVSIEELAKLVNPVIRGWFNYFSKFAAGSAKRILTYVNLTIARWTKSKYKSMKGSTLKAMRFLKRIAKCNPNLFYHWQIGLLPAIG